MATSKSEIKHDRAPGIVEICRIAGNEHDTIAYHRGKGIIKSSVNYQICQKEMILKKRTDISDGEVFTCSECCTRKSIRTGTPFENSRLKMSILLMLTYFFAIDFQVYEVLKMLPEISEMSVIEWFNIFRDVCSRNLIHTVALCGDISGNIIEIDESLFGKKRKYHRGTGRQNTWVFGCVERNTRKAFLQIVDKRDRDTLLPIIKTCVNKGSTIYSDQWAAYFTLNDEGYTHDTVNHSKEFKSSSGCCTNSIEGLWGLVELKIKKMKGILPHKLPQILGEFIFRYRYGLPNGDVFKQLMLDISKEVK